MLVKCSPISQSNAGSAKINSSLKKMELFSHLSFQAESAASHSLNQAVVGLFQPNLPETLKRIKIH